jgi:hypothetical protein
MLDRMVRSEDVNEVACLSPSHAGMEGKRARKREQRATNKSGDYVTYG